MRQLVQQSRVCLTVSGQRLPPPDSRGAFVINFGSSSSPASLSSPDHPVLGKYSFFISRRREDGRDRFRLHMGFFERQQAAEALLETAREIYPGAWVGVGPGASPPVVAPPAEPAPTQQAEELLILEESLSSVRAAIAALAESLEPEPAPVPRAETLSPARTLALLEEDGAATKPAPGRTAANDAVAGYAVQLRWSTQPISVSGLPQLAIFDAYTLYRAKGRELHGSWHALRLGFFADPVSAEQVANYIRAEFTEVSVVPVGSAERDSATAASVAFPERKPVAPVAGDAFRLIEDGVRPGTDPGGLELMLSTDIASRPVTSGADATVGEKVPRRQPPASLEQALDVLGAGKLQIDGTRGELLDASAVRRMWHAADRRPKPQSKLSRLIGRLAESIGGGR